jgi:hypothetical protein
LTPFNEFIVPRAHKRQIYRPQGWISAVILADGNMRGIWEYDIQRSQTTARVRLFSPLTPANKEELEAEAERLGAYLNTKVVIEMEMM